MVFNRKLYQYLLNWKEKSNRKPLIIRGARQVGKSTLVAQFGKTFSHYISLNLEKKEYKKIFDTIEKTSDILNSIYLQTNTPRDGKATLLFIDEIQESPRAIQQLRYFYEEHSDLYVIAAGSLLESAISKVTSFPVGRVEQVVLHPFDFEEYLMAMGLEGVVKELNTIPVNKYAHQTMLGHFHNFVIIGGMPEVIKRFREDETMANLPEVYENLWQSYRDDVEKYARSAKERNVIRYIIDAAPGELDRVSFTNFAGSNYNARDVGEAFRSLDFARIIRVLYPTTSIQPPVVVNLRRKPRLQFLDTGLLNYSLGLQGQMFGIEDMNQFHKGRIIQHLVVQEVTAQHEFPLYKPTFWVREKANSSAEVDLVLQAGAFVIPVEVKSGKQGRLRSLHQFMDRTNHCFAVRLLANHFSIENAETIDGKPFLLMNLPYYLACKVPQYIKWFIEKYN